MKLQTSKLTETELSGNLEAPRKFSIVASKEAFRILSSGLYNNRILAIIRELSCNAYDAHIAAGKRDIPFELHLPTTFEPWFSIKDNGIGLAHDDIFQLYTSYFSSNKTESNEFIGALGLGSKSPFSYTDGFTVTSRFNGKTAIYAAFIDNDGVPNITLQSEEDTPNSENGLEVQFPVKVEDVSEFTNQAESALEFFHPRPIMNIGYVRIKETKYVLKTEKWGVRLQDYYDKGEIRAIQGLVPYKVGTIDRSRLTTAQHRLLDLKLDLFFELGDLTPAASREMLSNDERTIGNIIKALTELSKELLVEVKTKLDNCKTWWEARIEIHNLGLQGSFGKFIQAAFASGDFDGQYTSFKLTHETLKFKKDKFPGVKLTKFNITNYNKKLKSEEIDVDLDIEQEAKTLFVTNDLTRNLDKYIQQFLKTQSIQNQLKEYSGNYNEVFVISKLKGKDLKEEDQNNNQTLVIKPELTDQEFKDTITKLLEYSGNPPHVLMSEIKTLVDPYLQEEVKDEAAALQREFLKFCPRQSIRRNYNYNSEQLGWKNAWDSVGDVSTISELLTSTDTKFYILLHRLKPVDELLKYADELWDMLTAITSLTDYGFDLKTMEVYGIAASASDTMKSRIENDPTFVELFQFITEMTKKIITPTVEFELALNKAYIANRNYFKELGKKGLLDPNSPLQQFCNLLNLEDESKKTTLEALWKIIIKLIEMKLLEFKLTVNIENGWKKIEETYPLMSALNFDLRYSQDEDKFNAAFTEYINAVDSKRLAIDKLLTIENSEQKLLEGAGLNDVSENPVCS